MHWIFKEDEVPGGFVVLKAELLECDIPTGWDR